MAKSGQLTRLRLADSELIRTLFLLSLLVYLVIELLILVAGRWIAPIT